MENGQQNNGSGNSRQQAAGSADSAGTLLFQNSPYGNLDAIVESDGRTVYFYLNETAGAGRFGTRACWVRNLQPGPYVLNEADMQQGLAPMLPRTYCVDPGERPLPDGENLEVIWFEEGNGAALLEHEDGQSKILALIPPWSGVDGFHGYALECAAESALCWPLPDNPLLSERISRAKEFWQQFSLPPGDNPFSLLQQQTLSGYADAIGGEGAYFAIDGGNFPQRGLIAFEHDGTMIALTVAMGLVPQPAVELFTDSPVNYRRIELGVMLGKATGHELPSEEQQQEVIRQLSGLAAMPWQNWTWLGPGHTTSFDSFRKVCDAQTGSAMLAYGGKLASSSLSQMNPAIAATSKVFLENTPSIELPSFRNDPVNVLWLVPLTDQQQRSLAG